MNEKKLLSDTKWEHTIKVGNDSQLTVIRKSSGRLSVGVQNPMTNAGTYFVHLSKEQARALVQKLKKDA